MTPVAKSSTADTTGEPAVLAEAQLRAASVRVTGARLKVLSALLEAGRALSHQEVQQAFAEMDRVTLYRALDCLTEAGLAHKIAGDDRVFRFGAGPEHAARSPQQHQHGHFKCTRCARVFCLADAGRAVRLEQMLRESLGEGFRSHDIEFTIKGWCPDCSH